MDFAHCKDIFDPQSMDLIGNNANCKWFNYQLFIQLSSDAIIDLNNNSLTLKQGSIQFTTNKIHWTESDMIYIDSINLPLIKKNPNIITNIPSVIGSCSDLILDATSTTYLGGRDNAIFIWYIMDLNITINGSYNKVKNEELSTLQGDISIRLTVTNWYGATSSVDIIVTKSNQQVTPIVILNGINTYSRNKDRLLNGKIDIYSTISLIDDCNDIKITGFEHEINWYVQNENNADLVALEQYLLLQKDMDSLSLDPWKFLQPGGEYVLIMNLKCVQYDCDINTTHVITYEYSEIVCKIMGGDVILDGITMESLMEYEMVLNGELLTYDPDEMSSANLEFTWQCINNTDGSDCDLLDSTSTSIVTSDFGKLSDHGIFDHDLTFFMEVYDGDNVQREHCFTSITFQANIIESNANVPELLIIKTTAISTEINVGDKIRIMAEIVNNDQNDDVAQIMYKWSSPNSTLINISPLTQDEIIEFSESTEGSINLVLNTDNLLSGLSYGFQLEVWQYNDNNDIVAYGVSSVVVIDVLNGPTIITDSFVTAEECSGVYDTINDYLDVTQDLSVSADGDYTPLLYQFRVNDRYYLHPNLLSVSHLDNVYLPVGMNIVNVFVYDSQSTISSESIYCDVTLESYTECVADDIFQDIDLYLTDYEKYMYILQKTFVSLKYLSDYHDDILDIDQCLEDNLNSILIVLIENIDGLCQSNFVILLSQVLQLWIDLTNSNENSQSNLYTDDNIQILQNLTLIILDPCDYITDTIGYENIEDLTVSTDSIILNVPKIYYQDEDVTSYLSAIIIDSNYMHIFYSFSESLLSLITYTNNIKIRQILSSAVFVQSLAYICTSIPGEGVLMDFDKFSVYISRIRDTKIDIQVQNVSVYIPSDDLLLDPVDNPLKNAVDVLISCLNTNSSIVSTTEIEEHSNMESEGLLSEETVSITILGNQTNTANLSSNIEIAFNFRNRKQRSIDEHKCVWYDPGLGKWKNRGCKPMTNNNGIDICSCSHLTTFGLLYDINTDDTFIENNVNLQHWDYVNWGFGTLFLLLAVYIFLEIYPFFVDKYLSYKQRSVMVMSLLCIISLLYFVICIQFHFLKEKGFVTANVNILTINLLLTLNLHFGIYSLVFYSWFILAHSVSGNFNALESKIRKILYCTNVLIIIFTSTAYTCIAIFDPLPIIVIVIEAVWTFVLLIVCVVFIIYAWYVGKVLLITAQIASEQTFAKKERQLTKRLLFINVCITLFFVSQCILSIAFTVSLGKFNIIYRIIDLCLNLLFIIVLCWMYRGPMKRLIKSEAKRNYNYYCCMNRLFILNNLNEVNQNPQKSITDQRHKTTQDSPNRTSTIEMNQTNTIVTNHALSKTKLGQQRFLNSNTLTMPSITDVQDEMVQNLEFASTPKRDSTITDQTGMTTINFRKTTYDGAELDLGLDDTKFEDEEGEGHHVTINEEEEDGLEIVYDNNENGIRSFLKNLHLANEEQVIEAFEKQGMNDLQTLGHLNDDILKNVFNITAWGDRTKIIREIKRKQFDTQFN